MKRSAPRCRWRGRSEEAVQAQQVVRSARAWAALAALAVGAAAGPAPARADEDGEVRTRFDLAAVQALLAVQNLDGWLLFDNEGQNPIAEELVNPEGEQTRRWFYYIP